jgi:F-type H+-transporting ATPase subunit alpha
MKKVAGTLRLDLAQFRELEAFSKFGSDLDKTTKAQLDRGARLVEILKQGQYVPMPVEKQVAIIFLGTQGLLDSVEVRFLRKFEEEFLSMLEIKHNDILKKILATGSMEADLAAQLKEIALKFVDAFKQKNKA